MEGFRIGFLVRLQLNFLNYFQKLIKRFSCPFYLQVRGPRSRDPGPGRVDY